MYALQWSMHVSKIFVAMRKQKLRHSCIRWAIIQLYFFHFSPQPPSPLKYINDSCFQG